MYEILFYLTPTELDLMELQTGAREVKYSHELWFSFNVPNWIKLISIVFDKSYNVGSKK